jgi:valyl-tRNA synthetase
MLGDTALAVNPKDSRYRPLWKKRFLLPLVHRSLEVIRDSFVDPEFGTGIVKVTPAHDPNDFEMGLRHRLEQVNILNPDGTLSENGKPYQGLDRFEARKRIVEDLKAQGLFVKEEPHVHKVPHCYRCNTIVEPYLSRQWFVRMKPLARKAILAQKQGKIRFIPKRWTKVYLHWLENIRDWCISRQIWWGHQIPVWYCDLCLSEKGKPARADRSDRPDQAADGGLSEPAGGKVEKGVIVSCEPPKACPHCGHHPLRQDEDVLDTWFSSWLWPFSTLGWPESTHDLRYFYPTTDLVTAPDIIFFWVARMIMAGLEFLKEVPFRRVYIHGTVRTETGQKMSKSLGNIIDPIDIVEELGADALRFSVILLIATGQDAYLSREKFELGRNFTNKIWNASRFALMNLGDFNEGETTLSDKASRFSAVNRWILSLEQRLIKGVANALKAYRFNDAANLIYQFFWHDFCDWYLELSKPVLFGENESRKKGVHKVLTHVLESSLRLLHPFMPFLAEEIWQRFKPHFRGDSLPESIMVAPFPKPKESLISRDGEREVELMKEAVRGIRDLRAKIQIAAGVQVRAVIRANSKRVLTILERFSPLIQRLSHASELRLVRTFERTPNVAGHVFKDFGVFIHVEGGAELEREKTRIEKKIEEVSHHLREVQQRLKNKDFVEKAPSEVVSREKAKSEELESFLRDLRKDLSIFSR